MTLSRDPADFVPLFERNGYARLDTALLQPASLFLELSGEDIRRRLYLTADPDGRELCLRPEHTIPVCRAHLASGRESGSYGYQGPVFRQRPGESGEFVQAGFESFGRTDEAAADADTLRLALDALVPFGEATFTVTIGDLGMLEAMLSALGLSAAVQRRLTRSLAAGASGADTLDLGERPLSADYAGLLAAIEGQDPGAARAFVEDVISIAGIANVGGRSAGEIAERFLSRAANRAGPVSAQARAILAEYLSIDASPPVAAARIRETAASAGLDVSDAQARLERRNAAMAARGVVLDKLRFATDFARNLDYYTGCIFEIHDTSRADRRYVAAGGRYDRLLQRLGARRPVPAVGCSFWLDRLSGPAG